MTKKSWIITIIVATVVVLGTIGLVLGLTLGGKDGNTSDPSTEQTPPEGGDEGEEGGTTPPVLEGDALTESLFTLEEYGIGWEITGNKLGNSSVSKLTIPATYKDAPIFAIGVTAFADKNIKAVQFENSGNIVEIGEGAFSGTQITQFEIPANLVRIANHAFAATKLTSIHIHSNIKAIGMYAFYRCDALSEVSFEDDMELFSIGRDAFRETKLTAITLPKIVVSNDVEFSGLPLLGEEVFYNSSNLETVEFHPESEFTVLHANVFEGTAVNKTIEIPASVLEFDVREFLGYAFVDITFNGNPGVIDLGPINQSVFDREPIALNILILGSEQDDIQEALNRLNLRFDSSVENIQVTFVGDALDLDGLDTYGFSVSVRSE